VMFEPFNTSIEEIQLRSRLVEAYSEISDFRA
jgi:hypothetical protein